MGEGESYDLARIGGVRHDFLIARHGRVEAKLSCCCSGCSEALTKEQSSIRERETGCRFAGTGEQGGDGGGFGKNGGHGSELRLNHCVPTYTHLGQIGAKLVAIEHGVKGLLFYKKYNIYNTLWVLGWLDCLPDFEYVPRFKLCRTAMDGMFLMREKLNAALKQAMREKATARLSTLRLINAAIKDRDIAARAEGHDDGVPDDDLLAILGKMAKQRLESARAYEEAGRIDLSERERQEITVIEEFLPRQLSSDEVMAAVNEAIAETDASSIRDMGTVMGVLKARYTGQMDFGSVGPLVKDRLCAS